MEGDLVATSKSDNLSTVDVSSPASNPVAQGAPIKPETIAAMYTILDELVEHTHLVYDDYGTACQCQCQCNCTCTRGTL